MLKLGGEKGEHMPNFESENHLRMNQSERLRHGGVCSRLDLIEEHIQKHRLGITTQEYLVIADLALIASLSKPTPGNINFVEHDGKIYKVVLNGIVDFGDETLHIVRSVVCKGRSKESVIFPGLFIQVKDRVKRKTYIKPELPDWSFPTIEDAVQKFRETEEERNSFLYIDPVLHLIRVRKSNGDKKKGRGG
ncbi:MAG: hypothetical protein Q7R53_00785 [bacterium]|nr:hypothetical protein [bacterium]